MHRVLRRVLHDITLVGVIVASSYVIYQSPLGTGTGPEVSVAAADETPGVQNQSVAREDAPTGHSDPVPAVIPEEQIVDPSWYDHRAETPDGDAPKDAPLHPWAGDRVDAPMNSPVTTLPEHEGTDHDGSVFGGLWSDLQELAQKLVQR